MAELSAPSAAARLRALADQLEKSGAGKLASDADLASMLGFSGMATSPTPAPVKAAQKTVPSGARDPGAGHAPGASDVSKLPRGAQLQVRQLRWLLKTRLSQVNSVLEAVQQAGCARSETAEKALPTPIAGILRSQVKDDFQGVFDKELDHVAMDCPKLGSALQQFCGDFLAPPSSINQFCTQAGSVTITSAERHDACHQQPGSLPPSTAPTLAGVLGRSLQKLGYNKDAISPFIADAVQAASAAGTASASAGAAAATAAVSHADTSRTTALAEPGKKAKRRTRGTRGGTSAANIDDATDDIAGMQAAVSGSPAKATSQAVKPSGLPGDASQSARQDDKHTAAQSNQKSDTPLAAIKSEPGESPAGESTGHGAIDTAAVTQGVLDALIKQVSNASQAQLHGIRAEVTTEDTTETASARLVAQAFANVLAAHGEPAPESSVSVVSISDDSTALAEAGAGAMDLDADADSAPPEANPQGEKCSADVEVIASGEATAPSATPDQALAPLRGKKSPSQLVYIDWKMLRRAGGGDIPAAGSDLGNAIAALREVLFKTMFSGGVSTGELFVRFTPASGDGKGTVARTAALLGSAPVALQLDERPHKGTQLHSTVRSRKHAGQQSRGILGAAVSTASLMDALPALHRATLEAAGCDINQLAAFAALPLALRQVSPGVLVAISAPEGMMSDASLATRQLRNTVLVALLDTAQSVRGVLQDDMLFSEEGVEVDGFLYLPCSEVVSRMEKLLVPELLTAMLSALHCATLSAFLQSLHVVDLVTIVRPTNGARQLEPLLRLSFDPQHALFSILDERMLILAGAVSSSGAKALQEPLHVAPTHYRCAHMVREFAACYGVSFSAALVGCPDMKSSLQLAESFAELTPSPHAKEWPMAAPTAAMYLRRLLLQRLSPTALELGVQPGKLGDRAASKEAHRGKGTPGQADVPADDSTRASAAAADRTDGSGTVAAASAGVQMSLIELSQAFEAAYGFKRSADAMLAALQELSWQFDVAHDASEPDIVSVSLRNGDGSWPVSNTEARRKNFIEFMQRALVVGERSCVPRFDTLTLHKEGKPAAPAQQQQHKTGSVNPAATLGGSTAAPASVTRKRKRKQSIKPAVATAPTQAATASAAAPAPAAAAAAPRQPSSAAARDKSSSAVSGKRGATESLTGRAAKQPNTQGAADRVRQQQHQPPARQPDRSKPAAQRTVQPAPQRSQQRLPAGQRAPGEQHARGQGGPAHRGREPRQAPRVGAHGPAPAAERQGGFSRSRSREREPPFRPAPDMQPWHPRDGPSLPGGRPRYERSFHDGISPRGQPGPARAAFEPRYDSFGVERGGGNGDLMGGHRRGPDTLRHPPPDAMGYAPPAAGMYMRPGNREREFAPPSSYPDSQGRTMGSEMMRASGSSGPGLPGRNAGYAQPAGAYAVEARRDSTETGYARDGYRRDTASGRSSGTAYGVHAPHSLERGSHGAGAPLSIPPQPELMSTQLAAPAYMSAEPRSDARSMRYSSNEGGLYGSSGRSGGRAGASRGLYRRNSDERAAAGGSYQSVSPRNDRPSYQPAPSARPGSVYHSASARQDQGQTYGQSVGPSLVQGGSSGQHGLQASAGPAMQSSYAGAPPGNAGAPMQVVAIDPATGQQQTVVLPPGYQLVQANGM